jgi:hypothetical protein
MRIFEVRVMRKITKNLGNYESDVRELSVSAQVDEDEDIAVVVGQLDEMTEAHCTGAKIETLVKAEAPKEEKPKRKRRTKAEIEAEKAAAAEANDEESAVMSEANAPEEEEDEAPKLPTAEDLQALAATVAGTPGIGGQKVQAIWQEFGVPQISALSDEQKLQFKEKLEALKG